MMVKNVWHDIEKPLESHKDGRGTIADIFYDENINHVAIISSNSNVLRGNHYHKQTTQHILVTKGSLEYWYKKNDDNAEAKMVNIGVGQLVTTPPNEVHALVIREENEFIVFSEGTRGGQNYELDTFRVESIVPSDKTPSQL